MSLNNKIKKNTELIFKFTSPTSQPNSIFVQKKKYRNYFPSHKFSTQQQPNTNLSSHNQNSKNSGSIHDIRMTSIEKINQDNTSAYNFSLNQDTIPSYFRYSSCTDRNNKYFSNKIVEKKIDNQNEDIKQLKIENARLKQENEALKNSLRKFKKQSNQFIKSKSIFEKLRFELGQTKIQKSEKDKSFKDVNKKMSIIQQQNKLCGQIIRRLEDRIEGLLKQNKELNDCLGKNVNNLKEQNLLRQRIQRLRGQIMDMQKIIDRDNRQWEKQKTMWINEKQYYKQIIRKLQFQIKLRS